MPRALAQPLQGRIRYGAEVRRIEQDARGARIAYVAGGAQHTLRADRAICTLPFTVLREIEVSPAFSAAKRRAIDGMYLGPVARVFVQTRTRFWERDAVMASPRSTSPWKSGARPSISPAHAGC